MYEGFSGSILLACIDLVNEHQLDSLEFNGIKIHKSRHAVHNTPIEFKKLTPEEESKALEEELFWSARKS